MMKQFFRIFLAVLALSSLAAPAMADPAPLEQARTLFREGRFDQARTQLRQARRQAAAEADIPYYLGRIALHHHRRARAVELLKQAVARNGGRAEYQYWLGRAYGERAKHASIFQRAYFATQTKKKFQKAIATDPDHLHARVALVMYSLRAPGLLGGSREEAEAQTEAVARRSRVAGIRARGLLLEQDGRAEKALALYRRAIELAPERDRPYRWLAGLLRDQGRYEEAFTVYRDRMEAEAPDWAAFYEFARTAHESGKRLAEAEQKLYAYLEHGSAPEHPSVADALVLLARLLEEQDRTGQARTVLLNALKRAPGHPRAAGLLEQVKAGL